MPRVKALLQSEKQNKQTQAAIDHNMTEFDVSFEDLAKRSGVTVKTIREKRKYPDRRMTLEDIRLWIKVLHITPEQLPEFLGVK